VSGGLEARGERPREGVGSPVPGWAS
jgi:hypothetical protein